MGLKRNLGIGALVLTSTVSLYSMIDSVREMHELKNRTSEYSIRDSVVQGRMDEVKVRGLISGCGLALSLVGFYGAAISSLVEKVPDDMGF